jgi:hypothetical protein
MIYNITNNPRMIMRDANGNLHIINRSDCKNDTVYYQKLFNIKKVYKTKFKSIVSKSENTR